MKPDSREHKPTADYIRSLISEAALSQRSAAAIIGVGSRTMRRYCKEGNFPYSVQFTLEHLTDAN